MGFSSLRKKAPSVSHQEILSEQLVQQIDDKAGFRLRLPDSPLEKEFQEFYSVNYKKHIHVGLFVIFVFFLCMGILDFFYARETYNDFLKVRLLTVLLMFFPYWLIITKDAAKFFQKGILLFFCIFSFGMVFVSIISPLPYKYYNLFATSLLPVFALILTRLLFHFAIIYNLFFIVLCFVSWIMFLPYDISIIQSLFLLSICIICLISTFLIERVIRKFYIESRAFSFQKQDLQETNIRLKYLIALDGLTGIANRRTLDETLNNEWQRGLRNGNPLSMLLMDIDHFKFYNDTYGHQRGDECLKQVAKTLKAFARRPGDLAARYGGEEFAVILSNTELIEASIVATRILQAVQGLKITHVKSSVDLKVVTLSIGIAVMVPHPNLSVSQLIENADRALYCAKSQGRNRVAILDHQ